MDGEVKGETDQIVLNANPVEVVALTYESERVLVKYQKLGQMHVPHEEAAHKQLGTMFTQQRIERSPQRKQFTSQWS